nr:hypothetical protein [Tanacetum cinerariifolium]
MLGIGMLQLKALIDQGIVDALAARDADRSRNGEDSHDFGTGVRRQAPPAYECTYQDFMKCKPLYFKGTEGVVELTYALTWWNSHVKTVGPDVAYKITNLKMKTTDKYCPRGEIKKLEIELWNLKALMYARMFPEESDKIKRYIGGLPNMIHESVMASKPKTMQDNNQNQQQNKRQNTSRAYTAGSGDKKPYGVTKPLCFKCKYHHDGQCAPKCHKCNRVGHLARDCRSTTNSNTTNNQRDIRAARNGNAPAKVYAIGHTGTNPDSNVVTGTFLLYNRYASILFDTGADKSFMSTAFSSQIDITPTTLDHYYDVELADGRIIRSNQGNETRLNIISCTKMKKYMLEGRHVFLAHVTTKETEDKSEKKRLEDAQFLTLGSSGLVCQEKGWIILNVHRLSRTEQANGEESLSTPND